MVTYVQLEHLVDYQSAPDHWIHAKVLEIATDGQSCALSLFNNKRNMCIVPLRTSSIAPFHSHMLSAGLSDTKYLRYWPFSPDFFQEYSEQLSAVLCDGLLSLSVHETAQFFGARLPFLFAHSLASLGTFGRPALQVCEQTMAVLAQFFAALPSLQPSMQAAVTDSPEAALWSCWPEFLFMLQHLLRDAPTNAPEGLFDVMVSDYTSANCTRSCAHFLERFASSSGFEAMTASLQSGVPLQFFAALPLVQLTTQLASPFKQRFAGECARRLLQLVNAQTLSEGSIELLERTVQLAKIARLDYSRDLQALVRQQEGSPEDFALVVKVLGMACKGSFSDEYAALLQDVLAPDVLVRLLTAGSQCAKGALEQLASDLALLGKLPPHFLQLFVQFDEKICNRLLMTLVKKRNWECIAGARVVLPAGAEALCAESAKQCMPVALLLQLFPRPAPKSGPRLLEQLLANYPDSDCALALRQYFAPGLLLAQLPAKVLSACTKSAKSRQKLASFVFTLPRLLFLWVAMRATALPWDLVHLIALDFL